MSRYDERYEEVTAPRSFFGLIAGGFGALVFFFAVFSTYYTIDAGERGVLLTNGAISSVVQPGLHFKLPFVQSVSHIEVRTLPVEWDGRSSMATYSKDQQPTRLSIKLTYHIQSDDKTIADIYSQFKTRQNLEESVIWPRAYEGVKNTFASYNAVTAVQDRAKLSVEIEQSVKTLLHAVAPYVVVDGVVLQNIDYSDKYEHAVEEQMQALVEIQKIRNNLERERANAEIKVVQANAEATRIKAIGDAQASAIRARGDALKDNPALPTLVAAERWNGVLPTTMPPNSTVPFINVPR